MEKRHIIKNILLFGLFYNIIFSQGIKANNKKVINVENYLLVPFKEIIHKDSVRIISFVEIPFNSLQFIKNSDSFLARYQISIGIKSSKGIDLSHQIWSDSIKVNEYINTRSQYRNRKHYFSFNVDKNQNYIAFAELIDLDTRKRGLKEKKINLKKINGNCRLIDPTFFLNLKGNWGFEENIIPTNGVRVRELGKGLTIGVSGLIKNEKYTVDIFTDTDKNNDSLILSFEGFGSNGFFNEKFFLEPTSFKKIKNNLEIVLKQNRRTDTRPMILSMYRPGMSKKIDDFQLALQQMDRYLLTNNERRVLKGSSKKEKEQLFINFWKSRDKTPASQFNEVMHEFYNRIDYANEHFDGWKSGWETDRGQIYVLFGPPDNISRTHSFNTNSVTQTWEYYRISKHFIFIDQNGFGDYRLSTPFLNSNF